MNARLCCVALAALACGCANEPFQEREERAQEELTKAELAGASGREVEKLGDRLEGAEDLARTSVEVKHDAEEELRAARRRLTLAEGRIAAREANLRRTRIELEGTRAELAGLTARRRELEQRDLSQDEVSRLVGPQLPALAKRAEALDLVRATLEQQLELARLEREEARRRIQAEDARARSAEAMRKLAGMLFDQARVQASALELETISAQQRDIDRRVESAEQGP